MLLPLTVCLLRVLVSGKNLADVWLGASSWNDEAFYYKQVESMVKYGMPQGYFGYNESAAAHLTFGAWNPTILVPFFIWGKLFGWNMFSPYICNIVFLSVSLLLFGILSKGNFRQLIIAFAGLFLFTPLSRYLLSCMPEIIIISNLIVILGIFISCYDKFAGWKFVIMFLLIAFLISIRPYMAVFAVLPFCIMLKKNHKIWFVPIPVTAAALCIYAVINKMFTCEYLGNVYADWFGKIFTHGLRVVISEMFIYFKSNLLLMFTHMRLSITGLDATGAYFTCYIFASCAWIINTIFALIMHKKDRALLYIMLFAGHAAMLAALLVTYNLADGAKHLITFIVFDILLFSYEMTSNIFIGSLNAVFFVMFFVVKSDIPESYAVPYGMDTAIVNHAVFEAQLDENMKLTDDISWENTVIIMYDDKTSADDMAVPSDIWHYIYDIPAGFGISYCTYDYVTADFTELKSRYILIPAESCLNNIMNEKGYNLIAYDSDACMYEIR